jgi:hypothetical protein
LVSAVFFGFWYGGQVWHWPLLVRTWLGSHLSAKHLSLGAWDLVHGGQSTQ